MSDTIWSRSRSLSKYTEIAQNLVKLLLQKGNASSPPDGAGYFLSRYLNLTENNIYLDISDLMI